MIIYFGTKHLRSVPCSLSRIQQHPTDGDKQERDGGSNISVNLEDGLQLSMADACRQSSRQVILMELMVQPGIRWKRNKVLASSKWSALEP